MTEEVIEICHRCATATTSRPPSICLPAQDYVERILPHDASTIMTRKPQRGHDHDAKASARFNHYPTKDLRFRFDHFAAASKTAAAHNRKPGAGLPAGVAALYKTDSDMADMGRAMIRYHSV
jgi:hypothetical protein